MWMCECTKIIWSKNKTRERNRIYMKKNGDIKTRWKVLLNELGEYVEVRGRTLFGSETNVMRVLCSYSRIVLYMHLQQYLHKIDSHSMYFLPHEPCYFHQISDNIFSLVSLTYSFPFPSTVFLHQLEHTTSGSCRRCYYFLSPSVSRVLVWIICYIFLSSTHALYSLPLAFNRQSWHIHSFQILFALYFAPTRTIPCDTKIRRAHLYVAFLTNQNDS